MVIKKFGSGPHGPCDHRDCELKIAMADLYLQRALIQPSYALMDSMHAQNGPRWSSWISPCYKTQTNRLPPHAPLTFPPHATLTHTTYPNFSRTASPHHTPYSHKEKGLVTYVSILGQIDDPCTQGFPCANQITSQCYL